MKAFNRKLRLGLMVPSFDKGGLQSVVFAIYKHFRNLGHEVTVFVEMDEIGYYSNMIDPSDLVVLHSRPEQFFAELAARRINLLHYHYSIFMLSEAKKFGIGVIYTLHNVYTWLDDATFQTRALVIASSDAVVANSNYTKDYFKKRSSSRHENMIVIPNGVDVEALRHATPIPPSKYNIPEGRYVFAQFASFHRVKHHLLLIRAAESLARKRNDFHVAFFGNVGDERYFDEVCLAINTSPARKYLSCPGYLEGEKVGGALLGTVSCVIMATLQEGCGNAAIEAAAVDKPLIMTDTGIARDLAKAGADIEIIPPACDVDELTFEKIEELSRDGNTANLQNIVAAMERRINGKGTGGPISVKKFAFELRDMLTAYEALLSRSACIL